MRKLDAQRILLLVDLNGTLCFRTEAKITERAADLHKNRKWIYLRHGAESFLKSLHEKFNVCILTSMVKRNADAVVSLVNGEEHLCRVYDRNYHKKDPNGAEVWDTIRDTEKIFKSEGGVFGFKNAIFLDNEIRKIASCVENGILVGEYGLDEAAKDQKDSLVPVRLYLLELATAHEKGKVDDVRDWMKMNPLKDSVFGSKSLAGTLEAKSLITPSPPPAAESDLSIDGLMKNMDLKEAESVDSFLERYGSQTLKFECIRGPILYYSGNNGIQVSFSTEECPKDLMISNKLTLTSLWNAIQKTKSPSIFFNRRKINKDL